MKEAQSKVIKIFLIISTLLVILCITGFLGWKYIAPFGKKVKTTFSKIPGAKEATNIANYENSSFKLPSQIINTQIVRFSVDIKNREIENINATLKFKSGLREIKLGIRGNEKDKYKYKPFYEMLIQNAANWNKVTGISNILFQKNKTYNSIYDLIQAPPAKNKIGGYSINIDTLPQNKPEKIETNNTVINTYLRGSHTFYIQVDQAPLILKVGKQDLNLYDGGDEVKISIYKEEKLLAEKIISDDGINTAASIKKDPQIETIDVPDIKPGVYKIDINCLGKNADSLITKIETNQSKLISRGLFILDNKPSTIYTNSTTLNTQLVHLSYAQTIKINDLFDIKITNPNQLIKTDLEKLTNTKSTQKTPFKIYSPKNDIAYSGNGFFAFSPNQLFDPDIIQTTNLDEINSNDDIDYILTTLEPARQEGDWLVSEIDFDPKDINITGDKLYFSLEMPDLAKYSGELEIESFEVDVNYKGILNKIIKEPAISPTNIPTPSIKIAPTITATPSAKVTSTVAPNASPSSTLTINKSVKIKVLNAGAAAGSAARYATLLKTAGYSNTEAGNYDGSDIKNCTITYPEKYISTATDIEKILKTEYKTVNRAINYKDDQITINIGAIN